MMMTEMDDEDLEEELRKLDVREDLGDEDSDVTPTNSPPIVTSPPINTKWRYPSSKSSGFCDFPRIDRFTYSDDYLSSRSGSSLSWGEDEFEGEATRMVSTLFDQLDTVLYKEDSSVSYYIPQQFTRKVEKSASAAKQVSTNLERKDVELVPNTVDRLSPSSSDIDSSNNSSENILDLNMQETNSLINDREFSNKQSMLESPSIYPQKNVISSKPTKEMKEECDEWLSHFPHFRLKGHTLQPNLLEKLESYLIEDNYMNDDDVDSEDAEETYAQDGEYAELLSYVSLPSSRKSSKKKTPSNVSTSRVCSGSADPEVLREQIIIAAFDKLWPVVTEVLSPLLHQYAKYIIEQSVQFSSLSREPSTRGLRSNSIKLEPNRTNAAPRLLSAVETTSRPYSSSIGSRGSRSGSRLLSRPSSAVNRLPPTYTPTPAIEAQQLHDLLLITSKPLQHNEEKMQLNASSALRRRRYSLNSSGSSIVSLPAVNTTGGSLVSTPRTPPAAPLGGSPFSSTNNLDHRPTSSSAYARKKFQNKFHQLSLTRTIKEGVDWSQDAEAKEEFEDEGVESEDSSTTPVPQTWSRHVPFLPPINQSPDKLSPSNIEAPSDLHLSVRGTTLSAQHRSLSAHSQARQMLGVSTTENRKKVKMKWLQK